jgi:hypothetical protein
MSFYDRPEWRDLRYRVIRKQGAKCVACGVTRETGAVLHVDHIRPVSIYPELALREDNLQVLCRDCNLGKSNRFSDDFRPRKDSDILLAIPERKRRVERWTKFSAKDVRQMRRTESAARLGQYIKRNMVEAEARKDQARYLSFLRWYLRLTRQLIRQDGGEA